jgi:hypothetical protein
LGSGLSRYPALSEYLRSIESPWKYVMAKSDLHGVVGEFKRTGDISVLESALGYDPGTFASKEIYMMNLDNPKVIMPTGNERGVNSLWRPGGLTYPDVVRLQ